MIENFLKFRRSGQALTGSHIGFAARIHRVHRNGPWAGGQFVWDRGLEALNRTVKLVASSFEVRAQRRQIHTLGNRVGRIAAFQFLSSHLRVSGIARKRRWLDKNWNA